jgi:hypothetical protein
LPVVFAIVAPLVVVVEFLAGSGALAIAEQ